MVKVLRLDEKIDDETRRDTLLDLAKSFFLSQGKKFINSGDSGNNNSYSFHVGWENPQDGYVFIYVYPTRNHISVRKPNNLEFALELAHEYEKTEGEFTVIKNYKE